MKFLPELKLTLFNGWIFLIVFYILQFINVTFVSKQMQKKLFDRSNFTRKEWILTLIGKVFGIVAMILMTLTPIAFRNIEFLLGVGIYFIGMVALRVSVVNFITTPLDQPVIKGLYKFSRNPQETMLTFILFGIALIVGSWAIVILLLMSRIFNHFQLIAQEKACLKQYGESYQEYLKKVPRYILFF